MSYFSTMAPEASIPDSFADHFPKPIKAVSVNLYKPFCPDTSSMYITACKTEKYNTALSAV